ncbi:hypothetical protein ACWEEK_24005 [Micromonospora aurantiaca (nom. illeg.)]
MEHARRRQVSTDDQNMWAKTDVPCVGGPVDGRSLLVPIDENGAPPERIDQTWLWIEYGGELLDADMNGVYELESIAGGGPPWVYVWASALPGQRSTDQER